MKRKSLKYNHAIFIFIIFLISINIFNFLYFNNNKQRNIIVTFVIQNVFNEFNSNSRIYNEIFDSKKLKNFDNVISSLKDYQIYLYEKYSITKSIENNEYFIVFENQNLIENSVYQTFDIFKNNFCDDFILNANKELSSLISFVNEKAIYKNNMYLYNLNNYEKLYKLINYDKTSICNFKIMNIKKIDNKYHIFSYILISLILNLILIFLILRIIKINK